MTTASDRTRPIRVMVAEDDEEMSSVLEFLLRREGFDVRVVRDGRAALDTIPEEDPFDVVVLDVMMPFASGIQVVRAARDTPGWADVPVIMVSGKASESDVVAALGAGANDYLTKPFRPREFVARVRSQLARRSVAAAGQGGVA